MYSLLSLISTVIQIYVYILIAAAVLSWRVGLNIVNNRHNLGAVLTHLG